MSEHMSSDQQEQAVQKSDRSLVRMLMFFSIAWFFLTAGTFTFNPLTAFGLTSLSIGLLCLLLSIGFLVRYALYSKQRSAKEKK